MRLSDEELRNRRHKLYKDIAARMQLGLAKHESVDVASQPSPHRLRKWPHLSVRGVYARAMSALNAFEKSPLIKLIVAIVFLLTALSVINDLNDRRTQLEISAWDLFQNTKAGTVQRTAAVSFLLDAGASLEGIDFTGTFDFDSEVILQRGFISIDECKTRLGILENANFGSRLIWRVFPPQFETRRVNVKSTSFTCLMMNNVSFVSAQGEGARLAGMIGVEIDFSEAEFAWSYFDQATLFDAKFNSAYLQRTSFRQITFNNVEFKQANLSEASFEGAELSGTVDFSGAYLTDVEFSNAEFCEMQPLCNIIVTQEQLDRTWAWADRPPRGLPRGLKIGHLCDPKLRQAVENADPVPIEPEIQATTRTAKKKFEFTLQQLEFVPPECSWNTRRR